MNRKVIPLAGNSSFIQELKDLVHTVSQSNASTLLIGERGTGKKLFAQHLHYDASDKDDYFFEIDCRAFKENKIVNILNDLFYNIDVNADSFNTDRITLFISFIDLLSGPLQQVVLRMLATASQKGLNFKLICSLESTDISVLEEKVKEGTFDESLFGRLHSIILTFSPLRTRRDDILIIADMYLSNLRKKSGIKMEGFSEDAASLMLTYDWPGNVDELINAIQKAFVIGTEPEILPDDLGLYSSNFLPSSMEYEEEYDVDDERDIFEEILDDADDKTLKTAVDAFKKVYITKMLEDNNWNQTRTAKILGIQRTYVIRLMHELGIYRD